jgi:hypothetical protein
VHGITLFVTHRRIVWEMLLPAPVKPLAVLGYFQSLTRALGIMGFISVVISILRGVEDGQGVPGRRRAAGMLNGGKFKHSRYLIIKTTFFRQVSREHYPVFTLH